MRPYAIPAEYYQLMVGPEGIEPNRQPLCILRQEIYSLPQRTGPKSLNLIFKERSVNCLTKSLLYDNLQTLSTTFLIFLLYFSHGILE